MGQEWAPTWGPTMDSQCENTAVRTAVFGPLSDRVTRSSGCRSGRGPWGSGGRAPGFGSGFHVMASPGSREGAVVDGDDPVGVGPLRQGTGGGEDRLGARQVVEQGSAAGGVELGEHVVE